MPRGLMISPARAQTAGHILQEPAAGTKQVEAVSRSMKVFDLALALLSPSLHPLPQTKLNFLQSLQYPDSHTAGLLSCRKRTTFLSSLPL